jgi:hypothetical protein
MRPDRSAEDLGGRVYPGCCTSAFCGRGPESCHSCVNLPIQQDFNRWRERTAAIRPDPIWSPGFWAATRQDPQEVADEAGRS